MQLRRIRDYIKDNRGQSMVEFALVVPIFVLLVMGIMEYGRVINAYLTVTNAAREGARAAAVGQTNAGITTTAQAAAASLSGTPTVTINPTSNRVRGTAVTVTVGTQVQIVTPVISAFFPANPFPVNGTATMRMEVTTP